MRRLIWGVIKLALASLILGWILGVLGISTDTILKVLSLSPQDVVDSLNRAWIWSAPRLTLGALIVLPIWLLTYLFMPTAGE